MSTELRKIDPVIVYPRDRAGVSVVERSAKVNIGTAIISGLESLIGFFSIFTGTRKFSVTNAIPKNQIKWTGTIGDASASLDCTRSLGISESDKRQKEYGDDKQK